MAEQEKLTKAERKEQRRQERLEAEEAAAAKAAKDRVRNSIIGVVVVALIGGMVFLALDNTSEVVVAGETITRAEGEDALAAAGCEEIDTPDLEDRTHYEPTSVPPAESVYTAGRPTDSGPHYTRTNPVIDGVSDRQLDEFATTHNLEHGSIIAWYDPARVEGDTVDVLDEFVATYNAAGFEQELSGAGLFASPYEEPGITTSDKPIALRAWNVSMDCDTISETALKAFTIEHYGTNGTAPEAALGPYPGEVLGYDDEAAESNEDVEVDPGDMTVEDDTTTDDEG